MNMVKISVLCCVGLLGAGIQAGALEYVETFENTGLPNNVTSPAKSGSFTGNYGVVWDYTYARGSDSIDGSAAISLYNGELGEGTLQTKQPLTGGFGRISVDMKLAGGALGGADFWAGSEKIGSFRISTVGSTRSFVMNALTEDGMPIMDDCILRVVTHADNQILTLDNLSWEPFRLYARLDQSGTNHVAAWKEFVVNAEVFSTNQPVEGYWDISPGIHGCVQGQTSTNLVITPAPEDVGQTIQLTYVVFDSVDGGYTNTSRTWLKITPVESDRFVDVDEAAGWEYSATTVEQTLKGRTWLCQNVRRSQALDPKIGVNSLRFRPQTGAPAFFASKEAFQGVGTVSLHYAPYSTGQSHVVKFELQTSPDGESWTTVPDGQFQTTDTMNISNTVFSVDVNRPGNVWVRIIASGNIGKLGNIDSIYIREYEGETDISFEEYEITEFSLDHVVVSGTNGTARTFVLFAVENLLNGTAPTNWSWSTHVTTTAQEVTLDMPTLPDSNVIFGVTISLPGL